MTREPLCPRCRVPLHEGEVDDVLAHFTVLECTDCEGRFFQGEDLRRIEDIIAPRLLEIRHLPPKSEQVVPLRCPVCDGAPVMAKLEHQRDRKVITDVCPTCRGTWLDRGELSAIQQEGLLVFLVNTFRWVKSIL